MPRPSQALRENQRLDAETLQIVAEEFGFEMKFVDADETIEIEEEGTFNYFDIFIVPLWLC